MEMSRRAIAVVDDYALGDLAYRAECAIGHRWNVGRDEIEQIRARLSLLSYDAASSRNIGRLLRDMPHVLECPECAAAARAAQMAAFDDPDRLRTEGTAE